MKNKINPIEKVIITDYPEIIFTFFFNFFRGERSRTFFRNLFYIDDNIFSIILNIIYYMFIRYYSIMDGIYLFYFLNNN